MGPNSKAALADALLAIADELRMQRGVLNHVARKVGVAEMDLTEHDLRIYNLEHSNGTDGPNRAA